MLTHNVHQKIYIKLWFKLRHIDSFNEDIMRTIFCGHWIEKRPTGAHRHILPTATEKCTARACPIGCLRISLWMMNSIVHIRNERCFFGIVHTATSGCCFSHCVVVQILQLYIQSYVEKTISKSLCVYAQNQVNRNACKNIKIKDQATTKKTNIDSTFP